MAVSMRPISSKRVISLDFRFVLVIVAQSQQTLRMFDDESGIKCIRLFFLIDSVDCFKDLTSDKLIVSINCVYDFPWPTVFMSAIVEAKK